MGMIESIRNRQTLLMTLIGLGMLSFLIPYDAVIALFGSNPGSQAAGSVNGNDVSFLEYRTRVQERRSLFNYTDERSAQNEVWNDIVSERLYGDNFDALGLGLCKEEFDDIRYGDYISPWVTRTFYGGQVTEAQKENWRREFSAMYSDPNGRAQYAGYARVIQQKRMREKFDALVSKGLAANTLEGKREFLRGEQKVDFRYVLKRYSTIPDADVEVSDADVKAFYRAHKGDAQYAQTAGRDIEYIRIPLTPGAEDRNRFESDFDQWAQGWGAAESDSAYLAENGLAADTKVLEIIGEALDQETKAAELEAAEVGTIVGPYFDGENIRIEKVISKEAVADSVVKCRHILLKTADINDDNQLAELEARADSLKRRLRAGDAFADLVNKHSEDPGSKATGGEYEFRRGRMVKPFEDFCFDKRVGSIGTAKTNYGLHLIEVLDQQWTSDAVTVQRVERKVSVSSETAKASQQVAMDFAIENGNAKDFRAAADEGGYAIVEARDVQSGAAALTGLQNAAEVVGWAYGADVDDVSNPFLIDDQYVIACLARVKVAGEPPFENVEDAMRAGAIKEKKAEMYLELMAGGTLDEIAQRAGASVATANGISLKAPSISGAGSAPEPDVVGAALALPLDVISTPIKGGNGVWVIAPVTRNEVAASGDFKSQVTTLNNQTYFRNLPIGSGSPIRLSNAIQDKAEVEDLRQGS